MCACCLVLGFVCVLLSWWGNKSGKIVTLRGLSFLIGIMVMVPLRKESPYNVTIVNHLILG